MLARVMKIKRICLALVIVLALVNLAAWLLTVRSCELRHALRLMNADASLSALLCAFSLKLSEPSQSGRRHRLSSALAVAATLLAVCILVAEWLGRPFGISAFFPWPCAPVPSRMSPLAAAVFVLIGIAALAARSANRFVIRLADLLAVVLSLLVLILISGFVFGAVHIYGATGDTPVSPHTLVCFALLANVVMLRRADSGIFSILLGSGIGGGFARLLAPFLILLPFVREAGRARLVDARLIPPHYATAILASLAAMISLLFLLLLAWYINNMELEIRGLTLRDELTGLYNLRGFTLLAEQALRLAQRSHLPFAVLFLDLDDLKQVNDSLGHDAGSAYLAETGQLLKATFRETDVMARMGGDEFAVAGSFTESSIAVAAQRLRAAAAAKNAETGRSLPLTFSLGFTCATGAPGETLKDLLAEADRAMYSEKRGRKTGG